jgi:hypothetical protein
MNFKILLIGIAFVAGSTAEASCVAVADAFGSFTVLSTDTAQVTCEQGNGQGSKRLETKLKEVRLKQEDGGAIFVVTGDSAVAGLKTGMRIRGRIKHHCCDTIGNNRCEKFEELLKGPSEASVHQLICRNNLAGEFILWIEPKNSRESHSHLK